MSDKDHNPLQPFLPELGRSVPSSAERQGWGEYDMVTNRAYSITHEATWRTNSAIALEAMNSHPVSQEAQPDQAPQASPNVSHERLGRLIALDNDLKIAAEIVETEARSIEDYPHETAA